jgi:hypothetical protein
MRWIFCISLGVPLLFWLAPARAFPLHPDALAVQTTPQTMDFTLEGAISRHEPGKLVISAEGNMIFHARYDEQTTILHADGSPASAKDLHVGIKVRIEGELPESGELIAHRITLL